MSILRVNTIENEAGTTSFKTDEIPNAGAFSFRNKLMNGGFDIWQRGTTKGASQWQYIADRWMMGGITSASKYDDTYGNYGLQIKADIANTSDNCYIGQHIEDWKNLLGKTVTVSFDWTVITAPTVTCNVGLSYKYTSLDNPKGSFDGTTSGRKSVTIVLSASDVDFTRDSMFLSISFANNNYSAPASAGEVKIARVQMEEGSVATPFEYRPVAIELSLCQRYYQEVSIWRRFSTTTTITVHSVDLYFPVTMRDIPTCTFSNVTGMSAAASTDAARTISAYVATSASLQHITLSTGSYGFMCDASFDSEI